jgi:hypothetical protein
MEYLYLKPIHQRIIELLVIGHSHKEIAKKLNITLDSLYSYKRDMNFNNDCNFYQLIWKYSQLGEKYLIKGEEKHTKQKVKSKVHELTWFQERVGKKVFRNETSCKCINCTFNYKNGVVINDDIHANYLFDMQNELRLNYFDEPKTRTKKI